MDRAQRRMSANVEKRSMTTTDFVSRLHEAFGAELLRYLVRRLGRQELAEEVAQETYLQLHRLSRPEEVVCPQALLFNVATKLASKQRRRARVEATYPASVGERDDLADHLSRPDRRAMAEETLRHLTEIVDQMPPKLREVFVMRFIEQLPRREIAERLSISVGAVEQRLPRALNLCRQRLLALGLDWLD
jgi:RNA polymerase sigma factor (sigma-70 family)